MGAFPFSPEEGTHGGTLPDRVPEDEVERRVMAVLAARDEVLRATQQELVGTTLEVLVDELHGERALARTEMDAPEVDLVADVRGCSAGVGERLDVVVEELDAMANLVCRPAGEGGGS